MEKLLSAMFVGALLVFSSCNTAKKTVATNDESSVQTKNLIGPKWKLVEIDGKPVADKINDKTAFLQLDKEGNRYSASGGCNGLGGTYTLSDNGGIKFSQGLSTLMLMACGDMEVEAQLKVVLSKADKYTTSGNTLSLTKAGGASLARFEAIKDNAAQNALNGSWELTYISGARIAFEGLYPDKKPFMTFNLAENRVIGNSSCNNFNATFNIDGNKITFKDPASTRMACPGEGESRFFDTLKSITKYEVSADTLSLITRDVVVMRLKRK